MTKIVIHNGRIIDPANDMDCHGSIYIADGKIIATGDRITDFSPDQTIDADNKIICPGFIDLSVHLRDPGHSRKGTIQSETRAAAAAGVTSLCLPPDTHPVIDSPTVIEYIKDKAEKVHYQQIYPIGALTHHLEGSKLSSMFALKQAGCIAVSNANAPISNLQILRQAMEYAGSHNLLLIYRPNEQSLSHHGCAHEGRFASRYGLPGIPSAAETIAVADCLELAELTGCRVHFSQISCKGSVIKIQQAKKYGLNISADAAIHQLHLTENDMIPFDSNYHVNPPFRTKADKMFLREGLANGTLDAVCSAHQPHDKDAKLGAFPETQPGIASLETLLPLSLQLMRENAVSLSQCIAAISEKPAKILGLKKGSLTPGHDADICIFDADIDWQINPDTWYSAGQNTPYWEKSMQGKVIRTLQSGKIIFNSGENHD